MNSRSDVILPHKKFTWADFWGRGINTAVMLNLGSKKVSAVEMLYIGFGKLLISLLKVVIQRTYVR